MFERIVAAIDSDPDRAGRVLRAAREVAKPHHSQVLVAHVRDLERSLRVAATAGQAGAIPPSISFESEDTARHLVDEAVSGFREAGLDARGEVAMGTGSTARELLDVARRYDANLIVVGDHSSHVRDVLLGSVAHRIVHQADCPVLIAR